MTVDFDYLPEFERRAKVLAKKYRSFENDFYNFLDEIEKNPFSGVKVGKNVYKTRMAIVSKGKGKSGGARILTYNVASVDAEHVQVTLMSIFDKSDIANVNDTYIKSLVEQIEK